uniref:Protein phosphatase 1 regulatory subunit n=1 Tax=Poecilia formosa TaxID=48698 RepID=A0A096M839_POEFO
MGDTAKTKRREQLKRWAGSSTDRASDVPRRRWRGDAGEAEAESTINTCIHHSNLDQLKGSSLTQEICTGSIFAESYLLSFLRKRVRFDRAAEFLAACASGDTEEAKAMLEETEQSKAEREDGESLPDIINCSNADGITALHQACIDGSIEIVTFLLEHGAGVNQVDSEGWTPLHVAASCGYPDIAEFLLQKGASLTAVNCDGDVPLDIALDETTESLLHDYTQRQGVDVEAAKRKEEEQMMSDAMMWLNDSPPADLRDPRTGATPLHVAAAKGYMEALKMLCQCGLDVSATDFDGWTPLHAAAHWGQEEACRVLAEQLCNMEARSNGGQTPFDVADESVAELLEELLQKQANWRNERSISERQNQPGPNAANAQGKRRRTSVCRMSSRDKINVQDLSKERGVSGGVDMSEEKESSTESSAVSSPDTESVTTSTVSPAEKVKTQPAAHQRQSSRASRTARVQPTPQTREAAAESPSAPNADKKPKQFQAADRDEESESQRKARCRLMRQSRRLTQGVTLTELKEAEKSVGKAADPPPRNVQSVSPIITVTPTERENETPKQAESEGDKNLGVKDRRRGRRERRSTGIVQLGSERSNLSASDGVREQNRYHTHITISQPQRGRDLSSDYKTLYIKVLQENMTLKEKLQEMEQQLSQNKVELERLRQSQESDTDRPALLELERFEKLSLQRKAGELEDELKVLKDLRADNQRLKDENAALIRVISKLSR